MMPQDLKIPDDIEFGRVAIVGGRGRMGSFFATLFAQCQISCDIIEADTSDELRRSLLANAATVIVSVPISSTVSVIEELIPHITADSLLVDLTSVKERPLGAMMAHAGEVLGLHPMFAPGERGLEGQMIVVCPGRTGKRASVLLTLFSSLGAVMKELSAAKHDQLMAIVQGLNHFHSIAFAHALNALEIPVEETIEVASPVYLLRMQLMGRILAQDPRLYAEIQLCNPYVPRALAAFHDSSEKFMSAISSGSLERCIEFFTEAASSFGNYRQTALRESDQLLAALPSMATARREK